MMSKKLIDNLLRASSWFSVGLGIFVFSAVLMEVGSVTDALGRAVFTLSSLFTACMCNLVVIWLFERMKLTEAPQFTICRYAVSMILMLLVSSGFNILYIELNRIGWLPQTPLLRFSQTKFYLYTIVQTAMMSGIIWILHGYILEQDAKVRAELENSRLMASRTEAAYQLLLQQIHPHFLFNALNTLKSMIRKYPDQAEDYLIRLSDFLRASLSTGNQEISSLKDELKLCEDYLEMQRIRLGSALQVRIDIGENEYSDSMLPVFSLQPLLENAIKHNELTEESPLHIDISVEDDWITIQNNVKIKTITENSTGSGLANISERHKLLTGLNIRIKDTGPEFSVSLKMLKQI
ncbi:sensor histidine kinase [Pedobacter sp.]|uniref:sensor histidine kinase n=1 Tax=Pedobacter sp. TaxID=1411316 RepID=UPI002C564D3F|nr:histidine kinase [Pedobacter sp.]HWW38190.1 histidine kinase [Pedobacter sp.]